MNVVVYLRYHHHCHLLELIEKPSGSSNTPEVTAAPPVTQQSTSEGPTTSTGDDGCQSTPTKYNNGRSTCKGKQIFSDSFTSQVREKYWTVSEQFAGPPVRCGCGSNYIQFTLNLTVLILF